MDLLDPMYLLKLYKQSMIKAELESIDRDNCTVSQSELNKLFEQPDFSFSRKYASKITAFHVACFFSYILPLGPFITAVFLGLQYWVDKYLILRRFKKPQRLGKELSLDLAETLEVGVVLLVAGSMLFKWKLHREVSEVDITSLILSILIFLLPIANFIQLAASFKVHPQN